MHVPCKITLPWNGKWSLYFFFFFLIVFRDSSDVLCGRHAAISFCVGFDSKVVPDASGNSVPLFHAHAFFFVLTEQDAGQFFTGITTHFSAERGRIQSKIL